MNIKLKSRKGGPSRPPQRGGDLRLVNKKNFYYLLFTIHCLLFTSCKMNYSFQGASVPPEAKTVSVQYFQNFAPLTNPTLSQSLTEALKDMFTTRTRLALTAKGADLNFEGTITGYGTAPIAIQSNDLAAQNRLTITISVKYTNVFDEKKNFETSFTRYADYPGTQSLSSVETGLIEEINKQLVQDIYNKAFNNW